MNSKLYITVLSLLCLLTIHAKAIPHVSLGNDTSICEGTTLTLDAGNNPGYSFMWSTGAKTQTITVTMGGTYVVMVSDLTGVAIDTIRIKVNPLPVVDLGNDTLLTTGSTLTLDAGSHGAGSTYTYFWQDGSTQRTYSVNTSGTYNVLVTDTNGCKNADTISITFAPLAISLINAEKNAVTIAPNPSNGTFIVKGLLSSGASSGNIVVEIRTITGAAIYMEQIPVADHSFEHMITLPSSIANGIYILQLHKGNDTQIQKILLSR